MTVSIDMLPNPNVCAFLHRLNVNILLYIKSLFSVYFKGGKTLTPENYKSLLATHISVRVEMTSSF